VNYGAGELRVASRAGVGAGADAGAAILRPGLLSPAGVAASGTTVAYAGAYGGFLDTCVLSAGNTACSTSSGNLVGDMGDATSLAFDGPILWWVRPTVGEIVSCPIASCKPALGSPPVPTFGGQTGIHALTLDQTNVYWTLNASGKIASAAKGATGATPTILATGPAGPWDITVDATNVYWTNKNDGSVMKVAKTGGAPMTLASGMQQPWGIAVDGGYVYFACVGDGTIRRVPK
jgi:hypothetical protein